MLDITDLNYKVSIEDLSIIITIIAACPIGLDAILVIMSVSTFKTVIILVL
jgi:hypothetical protein